MVLSPRLSAFRFICCFVNYSKANIHGYDITLKYFSVHLKEIIFLYDHIVIIANKVIFSCLIISPYSNSPSCSQKVFDSSFVQTKI